MTAIMFDNQETRVTINNGYSKYDYLNSLTMHGLEYITTM